MSKKVLITGISGQDGSYMAEYVLKNTDCLVFGMLRRSSKPDYSNFEHLLFNPRFKTVIGDLSDSQSIDNLVRDIKPDYFINLGAQSFVGSSWQIPEQTFDVDAVGVIRCLEAIRKHIPNCRFYNAGSSEEYGDVQYSPQDEKHPLRARSPYGAAKIAARQIVKVYRESYDLYAVQGLLFNHESERRGEEFVTRKITKGVARIYHAIKNNQEFEPIELGNLESKRDWSHAEDFVDGIWRLLNQDIYRTDWEEKREQAEYHGDYDIIDFNEKKDIKEYVLSSNETHTIKEFIELAFKEAEIIGCWVNGQKINEVYDLQKDVFAVKQENGAYPILVTVNPKFYRPAEVELLLGNSSLARKELNWTPKVSFKDLVSRMVKNDIENYG